MAGQFELGSKHLECMKLANQNITNISETNSKEIIKKMLSQTYGFLPSESLVYDDYLGLAVSMEEIAKNQPEVASVLADQVMIREIFKAYGNSNASLYLNSEETIGLLCSEPGMSTLNSILTKATRINGQWKIEGIKQISNEQLTSDKYLLFAKDEEELIRLFIVPEEEISINIINKTIASSKIAIEQAVINTTLNETAHVGIINDEFEHVQTVARTLVAATSVGLSHSALIAGIGVAKEVKNSEGQAISSSQNIQFKLADIFAEIEASRMLTYCSANSMDEGKPSIKLATMAKIKASDIAAKASIDTLHILGNIGYIANAGFSNLIMRAVEGQVKGGTNRNQMSQIYKYLLARK